MWVRTENRETMLRNVCEFGLWRADGIRSSKRFVELLCFCQPTHDSQTAKKKIWAFIVISESIANKRRNRVGEGRKYVENIVKSITYDK